MKKMIVAMMMAVGIIGGVMSNAQAQNPYQNPYYNEQYNQYNQYQYYQQERPSINYRLDNQKARIADGVNSGRISSQEANKLISRQAEIVGQLNHDRKYGNLSYEQREQLQSELDSISSRIYELKHRYGFSNPIYGNYYQR